MKPPSLRFLQDDLTITHVADGRVRVTVVLPSEYLSQFVHLVDSLSGFVQALNHQSRFEHSRAERDAQEFKERAQHVKAEYYRLIATLFDKYTDRGFNRTESIKRIGADLRAMKHPWSSPDLIRFSLPYAGRPGNCGRRQ
nr:hypothetical protein [uncultured Desulfuromonas sp.]